VVIEAAKADAEPNPISRSTPMNPPAFDSQESTSTNHDADALSYDQAYTFGRPPTTYLTFRQVVRLTILRSKLEGVRNERPGIPTASGQSTCPSGN
jgi:hypothetical protein